MDTCLPTGREYQIPVLTIWVLIKYKTFVIMFYTYVLKSKVDNRLYKGHTSDLENRLKEHNSAKTKSTKGYIPWELIYFEIFDTKEEAMGREKFFKSGIGREFLKKIIK